jgi:hypothetical protein
VVEQPRQRCPQNGLLPNVYERENHLTTTVKLCSAATSSLPLGSKTTHHTGERTTRHKTIKSQPLK